MSKAVSIFGLGYVGSVTAACLASKGHSVTGVDLSASKVELLNAGRSPIVEPRMNELVEQAHQTSRLRATTDAAAAVMQTEISFLCVGTPSLRSGKLDLGHVEPV
jgi:GDP-mannose 6-dehydrogenase